MITLLPIPKKIPKMVVLDRFYPIWYNILPIVRVRDPGILKHLPIWLFNSDNDKASPIEPLYEARDILKEQGASIHLTVRKDGHDSWTKALKNDKVFVWLAAQKKGSHYPPPGSVMSYTRTWFEAGWQILLPLVLVLILGLVQRKLTKRLQTNGVQ